MHGKTYETIFPVEILRIRGRFVSFLFRSSKRPWCVQNWRVMTSQLVTQSTHSIGGRPCRSARTADLCRYWPVSLAIIAESGLCHPGRSPATDFMLRLDLLYVECGLIYSRTRIHLVLQGYLQHIAAYSFGFGFGSSIIFGVMIGEGVEGLHIFLILRIFIYH